jgi:hypothetical protein
VLTFAAQSSAAKDEWRFPVGVVALERELSLSYVENRLSDRSSRAFRSDVHLRNVNDGLLLDRIGIGDESALAEFYDWFAGIVNGVARRALGDAAAEEIVQETFLRVWSRESPILLKKGASTRG